MDTIDKKISETSYIPGYDMDATAIAYVKPVGTKSGSAFAVCSSDGTQLAVFQSRDAAIFAARQHDLEPVHIH